MEPAEVLSAIIMYRDNEETLLVKLSQIKNMEHLFFEGKFNK